MRMTETERDAIRQRVGQWERAALVMGKLRREDVRAADTMAAIESFNGFFRDAARRYAPLPTSGLVEQQYWFRKLAGR